MYKLVLGSLLSLLYAVHVGATTLAYKSFANLVNEADAVVVGTVRKVESAYDQNKEINSFITLDQLDVLNGRYSGTTLTLRVKGGQIDKESLRVEGSPNFTVDERVLLFVQGNGRDLVPLVGWTQGFFRISSDPVTRTEVIHDHEGNRVLGIAGGHVHKEKVHQAEAHIIQPSGLTKSAIDVSSDPGLADNAAPLGPNQKGVLRRAPAMSAQSFIATLKQAASAKTARLVATKVAPVPLKSVEPTDLIAESNTRDAAPGNLQKQPALSPLQTAPEPNKPELPKRSPLPIPSTEQ